MQNSSIVSVNVPCSTSSTYYVGGGGGGALYNTYDGNVAVHGLGGNGFGGATCVDSGTQGGGPGVFVIWWNVN